jgi:hypothetical protein
MAVRFFRYKIAQSPSQFVVGLMCVPEAHLTDPTSIAIYRGAVGDCRCKTSRRKPTKVDIRF